MLSRGLEPPKPMLKQDFPEPVPIDVEEIPEITDSHLPGWSFIGG